MATITRVAPVHLEFFPSVDAIAEAKAEILEGLRPGGTAVLNGDDPRVRAIGERFRRPRGVVRARPALRRLGRETERGTRASAMRFDLRARRARPWTWRCPSPGRTS